ncbi:MAG: hypothetical protein ACR2OG_16280 [Gemmatimonadaceae bacterium]
MTSRLFLLLAGVAAAMACGNPTGVKANFIVVEDTLTVYALRDTSLSRPVAVNSDSSHRPVAVRFETGSNATVVFDLAPGGAGVVLYPPNLLSPVGRTGLQRSTLSFEAITNAPENGYVDSASVTAQVGDVVLLRSQHVNCALEVNPYIYSKLQILAIDAAARTIRLRMRVDPDCGFRSFLPGVPTS